MSKLRRAAEQITTRGLGISIGITMGVAALPQAVLAAVAPAEGGVVNAPPAAAADSIGVGAPAADAPPVGGYTRMAPTEGKGMPIDGAFGFQDQYSPIGEYGLWMHNAILMPAIIAVSLIVLFLLLWVMTRYRRKANPVPSKTAHNTTVEVIWTLLPVLILLGIAVPSIDLLARQYEPAPADAVTVKVTGYQWYWGYTYPDQGGFEVISNVLPDADAIAGGEPAQLAADNRMVVPYGEPIRIQTVGADVIHSFGVPSLWFKLDAVPGRINEKALVINEPGVYYGQCMELCGPRHSLMPIAIEAVSREQFDRWVLTQPGGTLDTEEGPGAPPAAPVPQQPESAIPGAAGAVDPTTEIPTRAPAPTT